MFMRKLFVILMMLSFGLQAWSQDVITKKNGEDLNVSIQEITGTEIKYFKPSMPDGPLFSIRKSDVVMITYRDGSREIISNATGLNNESQIFISDPSAIAVGMKYKKLKRVYDYKDYDLYDGTEKYSLGWCGVASAFIPGLGQMIEGEWGRGLGQFLGSEVMFVGANIIFANMSEFEGPGPIITMLVLYSGALAFDIWSIVDAVRIAKVKNMYHNDLRKLSYGVKFTPYVDYAYLGNNYPQPVAGLSLRLSF